MKAMQKTLSRWVSQIAGEHVPDSELLRRFLESRDQAAFELLVHRYGAMVLGLCRRLLGQLADAEDAFQATFLTLAHQAEQIKKQQSLGSWLYKVAWRMSQRQRRRRHVRVYQGGPLTPAETPSKEVEQREIAELLAKEVSQLSEGLQSVVVLCCLRGLSPKEAAIELGCPANTVTVRLRRAREQLKKRLEQRGYLLSGGIAAALGVNSSAAQLGILALPLSQTALQISSQGLAAGLVSPSVACLLKGALLTMWLKPIQLTMLVVISMGIVAVPMCNNSSPLQAQQPSYLNHYTVTQQQTRQDIVGYGGLIAASGGGHRYPPGGAKIDTNPYPHDENLPEEARKWIEEQQKQEEIILQEAERKMRSMRATLHGKLKQLQETYTKAGDLDRALALREQVRRLELAISQALVYDQNPGEIACQRGKNGKTLVFAVKGRTTGSIWGDGIYSDDSDLATVAVHAGLLKAGQTGLIKVTIMPGLDKYSGSQQHGVTSSEYQGYPGSMRVEKAEMGDDRK